MKTTTIDSFSGRYYFLSNFSEHPVKVQGMRFPTAEHAFQAMKTYSIVERSMIRDQATPKLAKKLGNKRPPSDVNTKKGRSYGDRRPYTVLRPDWEEFKFGVMEFVVFEKFEQNPKLINKLLATDNAKLIEGNTWDDITWGCIWTGGKWRGKNWLGKILMALREDYANE